MWCLYIWCCDCEGLICQVYVDLYSYDLWFLGSRVGLLLGTTVPASKFFKDEFWGLLKKYFKNLLFLLYGAGGFDIFFGESNTIELSLPENLQQIVINQFSRVAQHERCTFLGNVTLGSSISLSELRELYHVVRLWFWI